MGPIRDGYTCLMPSDTLPVPTAADDVARFVDKLDDTLGRLNVADLDVRVQAAVGAQRSALPEDWPDAAIGLVDLTTLEGTDTPRRVRELCASAVEPGGGAPPVAAVCVYPDMAGTAAEALQGTAVAVAAVAGAFPSGRAPLDLRLAEIERAIADGATEIDVVIDRGAVREGRDRDAAEQLIALRKAASVVPLKVILETSELGDPQVVRRAAWLALLTGADFVKTSTGKGAAGATLPDVLLLCDAARRYGELSGRVVGVKASGGIRTADDARDYLALVTDVCGREWLAPQRLRFGASSLLGALVAARGAGG